ncbi:hypothetical protein P3G55_15615 [Leptospira sp. 96542]|nr:hypothetical protein [Leptospira sp. 96542]
MSLKSILPATTYILSLLLNLNLHSQEEFPASFILEKDTIFQGTTFKSGSQIYLSHAGQIEKIVLNEDQVITDLSFGKSFAHVWKKGTILIYKNLLAGRQMPEIPNKIISTMDQTLFDHQIPTNCELSPSSMILTMGQNKKYDVTNIQIICPKPFRIKGKEIQAGTAVQIYSKNKVTQYNEKYQEIEI